MARTGRLKHPLVLYLVLSLAFMLLLLDLECSACEVGIKALLIATHDYGPDNWLTYNSFTIENMLEFNGIPYEFFDIHENVLDQSKLDQ